MEPSQHSSSLHRPELWHLKPVEDWLVAPLGPLTDSVLSQSQHSNKLSLHPHQELLLLHPFLPGSQRWVTVTALRRKKAEKTVLLATWRAKKQPAAMASLSSDSALLSSNKELLLGSSQACCMTASLPHIPISSHSSSHALTSKVKSILRVKKQNQNLLQDSSWPCSAPEWSSIQLSSHP